MSFMKFVLFMVSCCVTMSALGVTPSADNTQKTAQYFASIQNNPTELLVFLDNMPKGADLHDHLAGATFAEDLIHDGKTDKSCFDNTTLTIADNPNCRASHLSEVTQHPDIYDKTINAWSMRDFVATPQESSEQHFFATFGKFFPIVSLHNDEILTEITNRAAAEHVDYLELMISSYDLNMPMGPDGDPSTTLGKKIGWNNNLAKLREAYLSNGLPQIVKTTEAHIDKMENLSRNAEQCNTKTAAPGCQVIVRYQYYALRDLPPEEFFAQLVTGFELAKADHKVVSINIVRPEDDYISLHQYTSEMQMLNYLHHIYPTVHIDLHAGELNPALVTPEDLRFHIRQAIEIGDAERIGHGVDIAYEDHPQQLLNEMATKKIPVEVCLSSNAESLGISGNQHPLPLYLANHVPVVLATDDPGILRTDITHQYLLAIENYHLSYPIIKNIVRNGITYSFLPGESLWQNTTCTQDTLGATRPSASCQAFLAKSEKAQMQWKLENELTQFEESIATKSIT